MPSSPAEQSSLVPPWAGAASFFRRVAPRNDVIAALMMIAGAAVLTTGFVAVAPNRLVSGRPIALFAADPWLGIAIVAIGAALFATAWSSSARSVHWIAAALAGALFLLVLATAGGAARTLAAGAPALARISLGAGFWLLMATAALALVDSLRRATAGLAIQIATIALLFGIAWWMAAAGAFDALSLAREYRTRQEVFVAALLRHIVLVAAAVGPAVLIGAPLGIAAARRPRLQAPLFATLNLLQTIPSIALFGLLIAPLSALAGAFPALAAAGVGGVGPAPAIIALILYALLPLVRNTTAGIAGVDPAVVDAARGMGMTARQLLWRVELPLALPLLFAGLRIVTVQAIGLAVVAALIGAGGLGSFVFEGLGQYAADLVLLGALPAIGMALAADFLLQCLAAMLARR